MKRFTLGHESAAGWHVLDGIRMRTFYVDAENKGQAQDIVDALNVVDSIRTRRERDEARARAEFYMMLERIRDAA